MAKLMAIHTTRRIEYPVPLCGNKTGIHSQLNFMPISEFLNNLNHELACKKCVAAAIKRRNRISKKNRLEGANS